jgi:hypothetical protein
MPQSPPAVPTAGARLISLPIHWFALGCDAAVQLRGDYLAFIRRPWHLARLGEVEHGGTPPGRRSGSGALGYHWSSSATAVRFIGGLGFQLPKPLLRRAKTLIADLDAETFCCRAELPVAEPILPPIL